jgi:hypothetical protein
VGYFNLAPNKTYYIIVINDVSTTTVDQDPITLTFDFVTIPTNDLCTGAIDIMSVPFSSGKVPLPLLTSDANDPGCSATSFAQGAWYKYTPAVNQSIGFRSNVSSPDIDVVVFSAPAMNPCTGLTFVECATTASSTLTYRVDLTGGTTYYFRSPRASTTSRSPRSPRRPTTRALAPRLWRSPALRAPPWSRPALVRRTISTCPATTVR